MDILDAIKQYKLQSLNRSFSAKDRYDQEISTKAQLVKQSTFTTGDMENGVALQLRALYYLKMEEYYGKKLHSKVTTSNRSLALWKRVEAACTKAGVPPDDYLTAQFVYFHKIFGTAPKLNQLATENAVMRARTAGESRGKVVGNDIRAKTSVSDVLRFAEKQMQEICKAQGMTRQEVYENLVVTGVIAFPAKYLDSDPVYQKVLAAVAARGTNLQELGLKGLK